MKGYFKQDLTQQEITRIEVLRLRRERLNRNWGSTIGKLNAHRKSALFSREHYDYLHARKDKNQVLLGLLIEERECIMWGNLQPDLICK